MREPVAAGQFYPQDPGTLRREMANLIHPVREEDKVDAIGAISPHAGYMYSGGVAGEVFSSIEAKGTYIIIGPNHTGYGAPFSLSAEPWHTPLGDVDIDMDLAEAIRERTSLIEEDKSAHMTEHSIEVQLPFIQTVSAGAKILPLTVSRGEFRDLAEIGRAIAGAVNSISAEVCIVASSDMTHYETRASASAKDREAIEKIIELDAEGLMRTVEAHNISMCGYVPSVIMLITAIGLGARNAKLIKYTDSGRVTGDTDGVVGYAGIVVF